MLVVATICSTFRPDARGTHAVLTDAGLERLRKARPAHVAGVRRRFLARLEPGEAERLAEIWRRLGADESARPSQP